MCVVCPRDSSAATPHVCLGRKGESLSSPLLSSPLSSSPLETASHTGRLMLLLPWCWGVLVIGVHTYSQAERENCGLLSPKLGKDAIISHLSLFFPPL